MRVDDARTDVSRDEVQKLCLWTRFRRDVCGQGSEELSGDEVQKRCLGTKIRREVWGRSSEEKEGVYISLYYGSILR